MTERMDQCGGSGAGSVSRGGFWHEAVVGKKRNCVGVAFGGCLGDVDTVAAIVLGGWDQVPAIDTASVPRATLSGFFMDDNTSSWRG
jgi:hypothetical protein